MPPSLKLSIVTFSNRSGVSRLIGRSAWRRRRLLVLCYHGVSLRDEHEWNPGLYVSPATLAARFDVLRRTGCNVLPLGEAVERLYRGDLPDRAVALTFDDGYFDFMKQAWPLLQRYNFPATIYLATLRCDHNTPITNLILPYVLWTARRTVLDGRDLPGLEERVWPLDTPAQRHAVAERVIGHARRLNLTLARKDEIVRQISVRLEINYDALAGARMLTLMNPVEVSRVSAGGVSIELHTHRHRTPADPSVFLAEIRKNRERIEAMTGLRPRHFCYPSGTYRLSYVDLLRSEGVISATTCERGMATTESNPLLMPRFVDTETTSETEFEGWLLGAAEWMPRRRNVGQVGNDSDPAMRGPGAVCLAKAP